MIPIQRNTGVRNTDGANYFRKALCLSKKRKYFYMELKCSLRPHIITTDNEFSEIILRKLGQATISWTKIRKLLSGCSCKVLIGIIYSWNDYPSTQYIGLTVMNHNL